MDDFDRQLLLFLQNGIPLRKRPFQGIADRLQLDSADVLLRISRLKLRKNIRQITAVLEARNLGYEISLAAMMVPPAKLENALFWMNAHPGVGHCTAREHEFNLWFTLALPAGKMEQQLRLLHSFAGAKKTIFLPELKRFKGEPGIAFSSGSSGVAFASAELELLRKIQDDFPLDDEPFRKWAEDTGMTEAEVLASLEFWTRQGLLKKITALIPAKAPAGGREVLVVWEVPEERQDEAARRMSAFEEVADCVKRPAYPEFPYALHTAVRAEDPEFAELIAKKVSSAVGSWPYRLLWSGKEHKKVRLKYFSEGLDEWQSRVEALSKESK